MSLLVTVARAKQTTCFADVGTTFLTNLLTAASNAAERYCGRTFTSATYTEVHSGVGVDWLYLENTPITALTSLTIKDCSGTDYVIATSDLSYDSEGGKLVFAVDADSTYTHFPRGNRNVTVVYTAGYASNAIPEDVQESVIQIAATMYGTTAVNNPGITSERIGEWSATYGGSVTQTAITPIVQNLLMPYKRISA